MMKKTLSIIFLSVVALQAQEKEAFPEHESQLRIPFNHANYSVFEKGIYQSENNHTAVKPYVYNVVSEDAGLTAYKSALLKEKSSWGGRKLWNEHLLEVRGQDYWVNFNFLLDVGAGKENGNIGTTIINSRIGQLQGQIGKKLSFSVTAYETQGKFPQYISEYIKINKPEDGAGIIPGRGKAKGFGEQGFDYGISTGYVSYTPNKFFNVQFGHGHNFVGNGYRSMFLSDVAAPRTYGKLTTKLGKVQYTNIWTWLRDFNSNVDGIDLSTGLPNTNNETHKRKYGIFHHLSWNATNWFNVGFFEGIMSDNSGTSGSLQAEYLNPIIFYKNLEFANGEDGGSGVVGFDTKFKIGKKNFIYTQFLLDEFTAAEFFKSEGYWGNKYAIQLGAKFFDPFGLEGLYLQAEVNTAKPFTYSHEKQHNYAHFGQPLAHLWGANFLETILIARYNKDRWGVNTKVVVGQKGFDFFDNGIDMNAKTSNGGNIFVDSGKRVKGDKGHENLQGNKATIVNVDLEVSYLLNPSNNLKLYAGALLRNFKSDNDITRLGILPGGKKQINNNTTTTFNTQNTNWFFVGLRADLFNNYRDY